MIVALEGQAVDEEPGAVERRHDEGIDHAAQGTTHPALRSRCGLDLVNRIGLIVERVSDERYFQDFGTSLIQTARQFLRSSATLTGVGHYWNFELMADNFQVIDESVTPINEPYRRVPRMGFWMDRPVGGSGLCLRPRSRAKFGQLYLENGAWQGERLISADWIADTVVRRVDISSWATFSEAYGFQWWLDDLTYKFQPVEPWVTSGYGGQYLFVIPSLDLVVAFTGQNYEPGPGIGNLYRMMEDFILAAIG